MGSTVTVNGLALSHKGSGGTAIATLPDVCKTPSPGGPVPIPYPNIARSSSLAKGTSSVTVDGGQSAAVKGSEYGSSNGDEAGTAGGVKSSTNMKEATWITYSFDVKFEGKNACRLTDKMQMNHGNTACLAGDIETGTGAAEVAAEIGKCPCCDKEDCAAAIVDADDAARVQTFEQHYRISGPNRSAARAEQWQFMQDYKAAHCTCKDPPNSVFPKKPCDVFRPADDPDRTARIEGQWNQHITDFKNKVAPAIFGALKSEAELLAASISAAGMTRAQFNAGINVSKNDPNKALRAQRQRAVDARTRAKKLERINHRVPKSAGGCPTNPGNLQPQQTLCAACQDIDQFMTDHWQG